MQFWTLYVIKINNEDNSIIVGPKRPDNKQNFFKRIKYFRKLWKNLNEIKIKVRSTGKLLRANVNINHDKAEVNILEEKMVFHLASMLFIWNHPIDKVLGGWIDKTYNKKLSIIHK